MGGTPAYTRVMRHDFPSSRFGPFGRRGILRLASVLAFAAFLAGCGQKGPLYHPPETDEEDEDDEDDETSAAPPASGSGLA